MALVFRANDHPKTNADLTLGGQPGCCEDLYIKPFNRNVGSIFFVGPGLRLFGARLLPVANISIVGSATSPLYTNAPRFPLNSALFRASAG